jgi:hypothetical protein
VVNQPVILSAARGSRGGSWVALHMERNSGCTGARVSAPRYPLGQHHAIRSNARILLIRTQKRESGQDSVEPPRDVNAADDNDRHHHHPINGLDSCGGPSFTSFTVPSLIGYSLHSVAVPVIVLVEFKIALDPEWTDGSANLHGTNPYFFLSTNTAIKSPEADLHYCLSSASLSPILSYHLTSTDCQHCSTLL